VFQGGLDVDRSIIMEVVAGFCLRILVKHHPEPDIHVTEWNLKCPVIVDTGNIELLKIVHDGFVITPGQLNTRNL
jgi:hypothetical protein